LPASGKVYSEPVVIGQGGMGEVFRARDHLNRWVALKRLGAAYQSDALLRARFEAEARAIASLSHPHIVQLYDFGEDAQGPFLVMEYVAGPSPDAATAGPAPPLTLEDLIERRGPLPLEQAIGLIRQLCAALDHAHRQRVIHRDVKPGNVLLTADLAPKLADFGLARCLEPGQVRKTTVGASMGTFGYAAPEQEKDAARADCKSDVYSLGATLWFAVTGTNPSHYRPDDAPAALRDVLNRALAVSAAARYPGMPELDQALVLALGRAPATPALVRRKGEGECPRCGWSHCLPEPSLQNRPHCEGCGLCLVEPCLRCQAANRAWARHCVACSADLAADLEAERSRSASDIETALTQAKAGKLAESLVKLTRVAAQQHTALAELAGRAKQLAGQVEARLAHLRQKQEAAVQAAWSELAAGHSHKALKRLEMVPQPLRPEQLVRLLDRARESARTAAAARAASDRILAGHELPWRKLAPATAAEELGLRQRLDEYVGAVPYHDLDAVGAALVPLHAAEVSVYEASLETLTESREVVGRSRPYEGEPLPPRRTTPENVSVWGCELPAEDGLSEARREHTIADSQWVRPCWGCDGQGTISCDGCGGRGRIGCQRCVGLKRIECGECRGSGSVRESHHEQRTRPCLHCADWAVQRMLGLTQSPVCPRCRGSHVETYWEPQTRVAPCPRCGSRGTLACPQCLEAGEVGCPQCQARGHLTCQTCSGRGRLLEYLAVVQTFQRTASSARAAAHDLPPEVLSGLTAADFESVLVSEAAPFDPSLTPTHGLAPLRQTVADLLAGAARVLPAGQRLARQRLEVRRSVLHLFRYRCHGRDYDVWLWGREHKLHAPVNPVTTALDEIVTAALELWQEGQVRDAALRLQDAMLMARRDPTCREALQTQRPRIPAELWQRAEQVWSLPKLFGIVLGVGVLALIPLLWILTALTGVRSWGPQLVLLLLGVGCLIYGRLQQR
jgi:serine/threonine protein kinase